MKRMSCFALALSLLSLSLGPAAPSALASAVAASRAARTSAAPTAAFPALNMGLGAMSGAPALTSSQLTPSLLTSPGLSVPALPTPQAAPALLAAPAPVAPAGPSVVAQQALQAPDGRPTPFAATMQALSAAAPEYKDMGAGASRSAADEDFQRRIGQAGPVAAVADSAPEVEVLVSAPEGSSLRISQDVVPAYLSRSGASVRDVELSMQTELKSLGISSDLLRSHGATAVGAVAQINTAVLRVPESEAAALMSQLKGLGLGVQVGRTFALPQPLQAQPDARTVSLKEMGAIIGADKLQAELKKVLGEPLPPAAGQTKASFVSRAADWLGRTARRALGLAVENPVLPWAVLDSWVSVDHPFLKGRFLKSVTNDDDGEAHGTHTAGTVVGMDPWNTQGRNYNIFPNGSASEGDILFKLNMAQQDGALATTNSWGDGSGNPEGAIEKLFTKTAEAGMHHSISAGNSGSRKNTIGGPAIAFYNTDLVVNGKVIGTVKRIKAVAASDADKKTAYFSSRGPGSSTTARNPEQYKNYPQKPDESGMGVNLVAPVPTGATVPELGGPGASMSGTSMSNPGVFGGFLLLTRGILVLLKDTLPAAPTAEQTRFAMDLARYAMTQTAEKVAGPDEVGDGFINVWSAFEFAAKVLKDNAPGGAAPRLRSLVRGLLGFAPLG